MADDHHYIYPYNVSMMTPCPFSTLKIDLGASKDEINKAAEIIGTPEADEARHKALSVYYHPPCNKARRKRRVDAHCLDENKHIRNVVEKVVMLYKTEYFRIGLRGRSDLDEEEFTAIKNKWDPQVRYEAEEMFWNGFGDCKSKLRVAEERVRILEAETVRLRSESRQQLLDIRMELKTTQQALKVAQQQSAPPPVEFVPRFVDFERQQRIERDFDRVSEELEDAEGQNIQLTQRVAELTAVVDNLKRRLDITTRERDIIERQRDEAETRLSRLSGGN